ncbi:type 1 glutamine amidotransferase [Foetidibacter luteolus]|uniref:type 1 glutamine amidotransferase n=1 Tax=Foetidibacter luteolus TaxID=2608880 RepID=UPI001F3CFC3E|nr:GMP synthase [Foetidibacter luteolus]
MKVRAAIIDMNNGLPNQGMRCIREILEQWGKANNYSVSYDEFDIRQKLEVPDLSYDVYISSGGPGSPLESENSAWEQRYFDWITSVLNHNNGINGYPKKHVFFICHSFQLACRYFNIAEVCARKSTSFGVFPIHKLEEGIDEIVFDGLRDPFYAVDSRDYQVIKPNWKRLKELKARILAIEKERPHVPFERAVMAVRFTDNLVGTQFHPEADAVGMSMYLQREDKKEMVIENHGEEKWKSMITQLNDPDKIMWTYSHILPNFLNVAAEQITANNASKNN